MGGFIMSKRAQIGDWVQIEAEVLPSAQRSAAVPDDTRALPLLMRVKGFAQKEATIGQEMAITTVIGREITGRLVAIDPPDVHGFGRPIPELIRAGLNAREWLEGVSADV